MSDSGWATPGGDEERDGPPPPPPLQVGPPPGGPGTTPPPAPPAPPAGYTLVTGPQPYQGGWPGTAPRSGLIPLYPMRVGEILDTGFKLLRATLKPAALLVLILLGPVQVLSSVGFVSPFTMLSDPEAFDASTTAGIAPLAIVGGLLSLIITPIATVGLTWLGARTDEGRSPTWQDAAKVGFRRFWPVVGAWLLAILGVVGIGVIVGVLIYLMFTAAGPASLIVGVPLGLAFVVVLFVAFFALYLVVPVVVVEGRGATAALARSWSMIRRRFWPLLGIALLAGLITSVVGFAVSSVFLVVAFIPTPASWVFTALGSIVSSLISTPLGAYFALAVYVDWRVRFEGYDVSVLADELRR